MAERRELPQQSRFPDRVRLDRTPHGVELYFPPFRAPAAGLSLALFGAACLVAGVFTIIALAPLADSSAAGMMALWLMSIFILPFIIFGVLYLAIAGYRLANSLTVSVTPSQLRTVRRVLGIAIHERRVARADLSALEAVPSRRYRWLRDDETYYDLVVKMQTRPDVGRTGAGSGAEKRYRAVIVAESLRGENAMESVKAEIATAARLM